MSSLGESAFLELRILLGICDVMAFTCSCEHEHGTGVEAKQLRQLLKTSQRPLDNFKIPFKMLGNPGLK